MAKGDFEISLTNPALSGSIEAYTYEVGGVEPKTIIDYDQDWGVKIKWQLKGSLVPFICGDWCISLFVEGKGRPPGGHPEEEFDLRHDKKIPLNPCGNGVYEFDFKVPKGTVKKEHCGRPYALCVSILYETMCHKPGPMAGYVELNNIFFYDSMTVS